MTWILPTVTGNGAPLFPDGTEGASTFPQGSTVTLACSNAGSFARLEWIYRYKPAGSSSSLSATSGSSVSLGALDLHTRYGVRVVGYDAGGNVIGVRTFYVYVLNPSYGTRQIAADEDLKADADDFRDEINAIEAALGIAGVGVPGGAGDATSIRTVPVDAVLPTTSGMTLRYDASTGRLYFKQLTQDDILTGFWVASFARPAGTLVEIGQTIAAPTFTATYSASPTSVVLADSEGTAPRNVTSTPASFSSLGSFTKSANGQSVTFTITASNGGPSNALSLGLVFGQRRSFGASSAASGFDWAFARGLAVQELATSKGRSASTYTLATGQRWVVAWAKSWGAPSWVVNGYPATPDVLADDVEPPAWQASHAYVAGDWVKNGSNAYRCATTGTSAVSGGPSGTGLAITDGSAAWNYAGTAVSARLTIYALSDFATGASSAPWSAS